MTARPSETNNSPADSSLQKTFQQVVSPIEGTPADRAGIRARDQIVSICPTEVPEDWEEGETCRNTQPMTLVEAVRLMRGRKDTEITMEASTDGTLGAELGAVVVRRRQQGVAARWVARCPRWRPTGPEVSTCGDRVVAATMKGQTRTWGLSRLPAVLTSGRDGRTTPLLIRWASSSLRTTPVSRLRM